MPQKPIGQNFNACFHSLAQMFPHPAALFQGVLKVFFQQAIGCVFHTPGQAAAVQQSIQGRKVLKALLFDHRLQVEFYVGLFADVGGIPQQAQGFAVGNDAPHMVGAVQVFLHQGMGRQPCPATAGQPPQFLPHPHEVHRGSVFRFSGAMGNVEGETIHLVGSGIVAQLIA